MKAPRATQTPRERADPAPAGFFWCLLMAWRDGRRNWQKLLLFVLSITAGIASMVGVSSFRSSLESDIREQSAELLGADFCIQGSQPLPDSLLAPFREISHEYSLEVGFMSMVQFPKAQDSRLALVRSLSGGYPYYGRIETSPSGAAGYFQKRGGSIVEKRLMDQYHVVAGDSLRVGEVTLEVLGEITRVPGQSRLMASVAPIVYIPSEKLAQTHLLKKGSQVRYNYFFLRNEAVDTTGVWGESRRRLEDAGFDLDTLEERKDETTRVFKNLGAFLGLIGFSALLLGCISIISSVYVYARSKVRDVAFLQCIGMRPREGVLIYLLQVTGFGVVGSTAGCALGVALHQLLPILARDFLLTDGFLGHLLARHRLWIRNWNRNISILRPHLPFGAATRASAAHHPADRRSLHAEARSMGHRIPGPAHRVGLPGAGHDGR